MTRVSISRIVRPGSVPGQHLSETEGEPLRICVHLVTASPNGLDGLGSVMTTHDPVRSPASSPAGFQMDTDPQGSFCVGGGGQFPRSLSFFLGAATLGSRASGCLRLGVRPQPVVWCPQM